MRRALLATTALLMGCEANSGTHTGNPPLVELQLQLTAYTSDTAVATVPVRQQGLAGDGAVEITEAVMHVERMRVVPGTDCVAANPELEVPGFPATIDLLALQPELFVVELPDQTPICEIRVRPDDDGFFEGYEEASLLIRGRTQDGTAFVLVTEDADDIRIQGPQPFPMADGLNELLVATDVATWFLDFPFAGAVVSGDGTIRIDEDNNEELLDLFEERLETAFESGEDDDHDHEPDHE